MAIPLTEYVKITSGVGGAAAASRRELIGRFFTSTKDAVASYDANGIAEYKNSKTVGEEFGTNSLEYKVAVAYFGFVSKSITAAKKISFAKWDPKFETPAAALQRVDECNNNFGSFAFLDQLSASQIGKVAAANAEFNYRYLYSIPVTESNAHYILEAVSGASGSGFTLNSTSATPGDVKGTVAAIADLNNILNMTIGNIYYVSGTKKYYRCTEVDGTTKKGTKFVEQNVKEFGQGGLKNGSGTLVTLAGEVSTENDLKSITGMKDGDIYRINTATVAYKQYNGETKQWSTIALTEVGKQTWFIDDDGAPTREFAEYAPMVLFASTNYSKVNSTKTYMYQKFPSLPDEVTTLTKKMKFDSFKTTSGKAYPINYVGCTQQAGKLISLYQCGNNADIDVLETSVYCNEVWMKDAISTNLFNLMMALEKVPANDKGKTQCEMMVMSIVKEALNNGTICPTKELTDAQKVYIESITDDSDAWRTVYSDGYWFQISISYDDSIAKYKASYDLVYSKGDAVRYMEGRDIMI